MVDNNLANLGVTLENVRRHANWSLALPSRVEKLTQDVRANLEPAFSDFCDQVVQAYEQPIRVESLSDVARRRVVEHYLSLSFMLLAVGVGQILGARGPLHFLLAFLSGWLRLALLVAVPVYGFLNLRDGVVDAVERRTRGWLLVSFWGAIAGSLLGLTRVLATVPSTLFAPPLAFALLLDVHPTLRKITWLPSADTRSTMLFATTLTTVFSCGSSLLPLGQSTLLLFLLKAAHHAVLYCHFSLLTTSSRVAVGRDKTSDVSLGWQFLYLCVIYGCQFLLVSLHYGLFESTVVLPRHLQR